MILKSEEFLKSAKPNFKQALYYYNKALKYDSKHVRALIGKAHCELTLEQFSEAAKTCDLIFAIAPESDKLAEIYLISFSALLNLDEEGKAWQKIDEGLKKFPTDNDLLLFKAYSFTNSRDSAIVYLSKLLLINPTYIPACRHMRNINPKPVEYALCNARLFEIKSFLQADAAYMLSFVFTKGTQFLKTADSIQANLRTDSTSLPSDFDKVEVGMNEFYRLNPEIENADASTRVARLISAYNTFFNLIKQERKNHSGFFWEYYASHFIKMYDKNLTETFVYLTISLREIGPADELNLSRNWLKQHSYEVAKFEEFVSDYAWILKK